MHLTRDDHKRRESTFIKRHCDNVIEGDLNVDIENAKSAFGSGEKNNEVGQFTDSCVRNRLVQVELG